VFRRLRRVLDRVYASRDLGRVDDFAAPGSPQFAHATRQIRFLKRHSLLDRTKTESQVVEVRVLGGDELEIQEKVVIRPRYVDEATGLEADLEVPVQRATLTWTLQRQAGVWRIYSAEKT
jgi:hypothetical protein